MAEREYEILIRTLEERKKVVDELMRSRPYLMKKQVEVDNKYPRQSAKYSGTLLNVEVVNDNVFLDLQTSPKEVKRILVGSKSEKLAKEITRHIELTRIRVK